MGAIFNGSNAELVYGGSVINDNMPADYRVLITMWAKVSDYPGNMGLWCIGNGSSGASHRGWFSMYQTSNLFVRIRHGSVANADFSTAHDSVVDEWRFLKWEFIAGNSRRMGFGTGSWTASSTSATGAIDFDSTRLGRTSALSSWFDGRKAEFAIWAGYSSSTLADDIVAEQVDLLRRPSSVSVGNEYLQIYRGLRGELDGAHDVGPSFSNSNVTFDADDHPPVVYTLPSWFYAEAHRQQMQGVSA